MPRIAPDLRLVCLKRGDEQYALLFNDDQREEALQTLTEWACDPELSFTWSDCATLSEQITHG